MAFDETVANRVRKALKRRKGINLQDWLKGAVGYTKTLPAK